MPEHVARERQATQPLPTCPLCQREFELGDIIVNATVALGPAFMQLLPVHLICVLRGAGVSRVVQAEEAEGGGLTTEDTRGTPVGTTEDKGPA